MSDTLATLASDPSRIEALQPGQLPELIGEAEALRAQLWAALKATEAPAPGATESTSDSGPDQMLTAEDVAERLAVDRRYVYRHKDEWPFTRRLSDGTLRFSERGLTRWVDARAG